jgi:hypothetical protein
MPAQLLQTEAFVLLKRPVTADAFHGFTVFSAEHGPLFVLQRLPGSSARRKGSANPAAAPAPLDLFDEVSLFLESSNQGRTWFVKETRLLTRHTGIGHSYDALRLASTFAAVVARNPVDEDSRPAVAELLRIAFQAFASGARPDVVYFKSLYRLGRDEGYPLKEQWFPTLPAADQAEVALLLNRPLADQTASADNVVRLQRRLEEYLRGHTEILLD